MAPTVDLVVFDLDGTLVDSMRPQAESFAQVVAGMDDVAADHAAAADVYARTAGAPLRDQFVEATGSTDASVLAALERGFWARLDELRFDPFPDAVDCIAALTSAGMPVGVSSGSTCASVARKLDESGLAASIPIAFGSDDVEIGPKGAAHIDRIVAHYFGAASRCDLAVVFVGDTQHDVELGASLALKTFGVQRDLRLLPGPAPDGVELLTDLSTLAHRIT